MLLKKYNTARLGFLFCILIGIILSVVFFVFEKEMFISTIERLFMDQLEQIKNLDIDYNELLKDVLKIRGVQIGVILLFLFNKRKKICFLLMTIIFSFVVHLQLLSFIYLYGMKGILFSLGLGFPHGMIYLIIFIYIMYKNENLGNNYLQMKNERKVNKVSHVFTWLLEGFLMTASCILGILVECFCNPIVLKYLSEIIS